MVAFGVDDSAPEMGMLRCNGRIMRPNQMVLMISKWSQLPLAVADEYASVRLETKGCMELFAHGEWHGE